MKGALAAAFLVLAAAAHAQKPPKALPPCDVSDGGRTPYCPTCKTWLEKASQVDPLGNCEKCGDRAPKIGVCDKGGWACASCGKWATKKTSCKDGHPSAEMEPQVVRCRFQWRCPGCGGASDTATSCTSQLCGKPGPYKLVCDNSGIAPHSRGFPDGDTVRKHMDKVKIDPAASFNTEKARVVEGLAKDLGARADACEQKGDLETAHLLQILAHGLGVKGAEAKAIALAGKMTEVEAFTKRIDVAELDSPVRQWSDAVKGLGAVAKKQALPDLELWSEVAARALLEAPALLRAYRALNDVRLAAGMEPPAIRWDLTYACMLHARYMANTGKLEHSEDARNAMRTAEGEAAARASVIASGGIAGAVEMWTASVFHRVPLLNPGLRTIGLGQWSAKGRETALVDATTGRVPSLALSMWPNHNATGVGTEFAGETPSPLPAGVKKAGYPITITFPPGKAVSGASCLLEEIASKKKLDCRVSDPANPACKEFSDNLQTIAAIPAEPLKARTKYRAHVTATVDGKAQEFFIDFETR